ncbi:putative vesicular protein trafficking mediator [Leptomonas pyrrhocoris]|uniref:Putative vesicular protein trafficking mediator n=1 Tax=Leptomonas pyrrhocoris TaxID=157538 RepID=A0A0M9G2X5_LEPPY|nr:putative vesicular protein trafficking mediator [Leptomonas pyrrhocoris]XP_015659576.1 putative vesicular protein trafficking mediator [Leptomonas pyrrhocoris]XP_015659577.1 putative vesicular protein trafficking mediator [Leptomonas pyrrhocoris]KPA81136.1 putative vesicular protein trafficking mediator [Leptomonas pyrrhocoris]KPA81137.1 putative vesicular protein trafficking mediator [Leptomonas pyrrhocoris]KPA81138.1 putative vesicular protein trafficking mediator [Leptomonas pyrrhocoris]|eukprot:XP_015659575.1 putative vesicular protein trafficking mediator [Leptomonas pyrrhocoris]
MGKEDEMFNIIFNMKFASKQMSKSAAASEKASEKEKLNVKKALEKGNPEAARIYAENAIRKRNEALNYLRLSSRLDAAASRVQTAMQMQTVTKTMKTSVKGMEKILSSMDPMRIAKVMDTFEQQVGTMDVNLGVMDAAFVSSSAGTVPIDQVDSLMDQVAADNNIDISEKLGGGVQSKISMPAQHQQVDEDDIAERLKNLQALS